VTPPTVSRIQGGGGGEGGRRHSGNGDREEGGGGTAVTPVVAVAPYVELLLGVVRGRHRRGVLEYRRGRGRRGTDGVVAPPPWQRAAGERWVGPEEAEPSREEDGWRWLARGRSCRW
jgi:hypothetical protein